MLGTVSTYFKSIADDDDYDVYYDCDEDGYKCNTTYNEDEMDYYDYEDTIKHIKDINEYYMNYGKLPPDVYGQPSDFGYTPYYKTKKPKKGQEDHFGKSKIIDIITKPYEFSTRPMDDDKKYRSKPTENPYEDTKGSFNNYVDKKS